MSCAVCTMYKTAALKGGCLRPGTEYLPGLASARKKAEMTQGELMEKAGIKSRTTISRIENGHPAEIDTARRLAMALKVSRRDLMRGPTAPIGGKKPLELLEDRLAEYQERGETNEVRWSRLHGAALYMLDHAEGRGQRKRLKEVARRAFDGFLRLRGIDPEEEDWRRDTERVLAEVLGEDPEQAEEKELVSTK